MPPPRCHSDALRALAAIALLLLAVPSALAAQRRPPRPAAEEVRALELGLRAGFDFDQDAPVLGTFLRLPVDPWRRFALMPGAEVEFLSGNTEWQLNADAVVLLGGGRSIFLGGGAAFRNARFRDIGGARDLRTGYSLLVGLRSPGRRGGFGNQFELRLIEVDEYEPRVVTIGLTWGVALDF